MSLIALLFFVLVGFVVSLDVMALTLCDARMLNSSKRVRRKWAIRNGVWHAFVLAFYLFLFRGLIWLSGKFLSWISVEFDGLDRLVRESFAHGPALFLLVTIITVWLLYSKKLVEDFSDEGGTFKDAGLIGLVYQYVIRPIPLIDKKYRPDNLKAMLVSIDMLALALIMNTGNIAASLSEKVVFIITIFCVVTLLCLFASKFISNRFERLEKDERASMIVIMRIIETFLIFYFVMELTSIIAYGANVLSTPSMIGAAMLTFSVVQFRGYSAIHNAADRAANRLGNQPREA